MNILGTTAGGTVIVEMFGKELRRLKELGEVIAGLPTPPEEGAGPVAPKQAGSRGKRGKKAGGTPALPGGKAERNKTCRKCKRAFYDESRPNTAKMCKGCRKHGTEPRATGGTERDPRERSAAGETLKVA